jgi:hypothetical protein
MQKAMMVMLAVGTATAFSSIPVQAEYAVCIAGRGCVPATQASYNACYQLALQRGWNQSDNSEKAGRNLDWFIMQCLAGKVPR